MTAPAQRRPRNKPEFPPRVNLRVLREAQGFSVSDLTSRIAENSDREYDDSHIRNVELGHQNMSPQLKVAWAKALGIKAADVILPENGNGNAA